MFKLPKVLAIVMAIHCPVLIVSVTWVVTLNKGTLCSHLTSSHNVPSDELFKSK